jgi:hypothetical protein
MIQAVEGFIPSRKGENKMKNHKNNLIILAAASAVLVTTLALRKKIRRSA